MTRRDWRKRRNAAHSFAARVAVRPRLFLVGSDADLAWARAWRPFLLGGFARSS
jgi:hypothetical protein